MKGEVDAIEDVDAGAAPANKKVFRNGEIIIIRDGREYNTNGKLCASLKKVEWILPYPCHWLNVLLLNPGVT